MGERKISLKQRRFVSAYLLSGNATDAAKKAGYSQKTAYSIGQENLKKPVIKDAIAEVNNKAMDATVAAVLERKQTLTEIIRGRIGHFVTAGADGVIPNVGPENIHSAALKSVKSRCITMGEGDGKQDAVVTEVEVRDQVPAIAELNKMEGVYAPEKFDADITHLMVMREPGPAPKRRKRITDGRRQPGI